MPNCGSQCILCNVPIRIDSYKGCSHGCKYCFVFRNYDIRDIKPGESVQSLKNFIQGKRTDTTNWCDWNMPLHWGGMSDPFQPIERKYRRSLEMLKVFAETGYPFIVSTKSTLPIEEPYFSLFKQCKCVFQCSMVCPSLNKVEPATPSFEERLKMLSKMSTIVPRVIARCQPYVVELHAEIKQQISQIAKTGCYGITFEALKLFKKNKGFIKQGNDYVYPLKVLKSKFLELKKECHRNGLVFLSAENRLRGLGDSLTCCGCEGLDGFEVSKYNLNYYIYNQKQLICAKSMQQPNSGTCFKALIQEAGVDKIVRKLSFKEHMDLIFRDKSTIYSFLGKDE